MPLYLSEDDVESLLTPADAVEAVEGSFQRLAEGLVDNRPRYRLRLEHGQLAVMAAVDHGLGVAGLKTYAAGSGGASFVFVLFDAASQQLIAVIEADRLGRLRTGAASAVAARHLANDGAASLGVLGCGWQAEMQVACIRAVLPELSGTVAYCRTRERLEEFCRREGATPADSHRGAAEQDIVVTMTTSRDPVLRG